MINQCQTISKGLVKKTVGQVKKCFEQMTYEEKQLLHKKVKTLDVNNVYISIHLKDKLQSEIKADVKGLFNKTIESGKFKVLEYNVTNGDKRVLVRSSIETEVLFYDGRFHYNAMGQMCFVISLLTNAIVTAYFNATWDGHRSLDISRYDANLKIEL